MGWGEDTKLEAGEAWAGVSGPKKRRARKWRAEGLWLRSLSCRDRRRMGTERGRGGQEEVFEAVGDPGTPEGHCAGRERVEVE